MTKSQTSPDNPDPPTRRQMPGNACEKCRQKKLRCDRQEPQCGMCQENGDECRPSTSRPRGPKRGHMKALHERLSTLESMLAKQSGSSEVTLPDETMGCNQDGMQMEGQDSIQLDFDSFSPTHFLIDPSELNHDESMAVMQAHGRVGSVSTSLDSHLTAPSPNFDSIQVAPLLPLPDLVHCDRDQFYFDRVHPFIPMLSAQRYATWSQHETKTKAQTCLQQTMWMLASSTSTQPTEVAEGLYSAARKGLEELEVTSDPNQLADVTQIQAWLLLALYEFTKVDFARGWLSAGRALRRVQLMQLDSLDAGQEVSAHSMDYDWVEHEELRRTFWLAYCFDRFTCLSNGFSLTLNEHVNVRLPAPDANFQSGDPVTMSFLSEAMFLPNEMGRGSFIEFIIMATVCGRTLCHHQQSVMEKKYSGSVDAFWERQQQINGIFTPQIMALSLRQSHLIPRSDPILLFTQTMAAALMIYVYKLVLEIDPTPGPQHHDISNQCTSSFQVACLEITQLARLLSQISCFKVHPLSPIPLHIALEYLTKLNNGSGTLDSQVKVIRNTLTSLKRINIIGQVSQSTLEDGSASTASSSSDMI